MNFEDLSPEELEKYFLYLDDLRDSGVTNMYGAPAYLEEEFWIDKRLAQKIVSRWMDTYTERHPKK